AADRKLTAQGDRADRKQSGSLGRHELELEICGGGRNGEHAIGSERERCLDVAAGKTDARAGITRLEGTHPRYPPKQVRLVHAVEGHQKRTRSVRSRELGIVCGGESCG